MVPEVDPKLGVLVSRNEIVVVLTGSIYTVTYYKERGSGLLAKNIANKDDPRVPMTASEFLAKAWKAANQKAKELGWIV